VIGQAKGILMHRAGISADDAFELLRRTSQDLNIKLAALAAAVANGHDQLEPPV
jgi:AmiR/NasT family two-component response regulator